MAGPWQDDSGALLVFRTSSAELDAILAADPYYTLSTRHGSPEQEGQERQVRADDQNWSLTQK